MWKFQSFWNLVPGDRKKIQAGIIILINTVIKYPPDTILSVISRHVFLLHYEYIERTEYFIKEICQMNEKIGPYIFARNWVVLSLCVFVFISCFIFRSPCDFVPMQNCTKLFVQMEKLSARNFDISVSILFKRNYSMKNWSKPIIRQYSLHAQICTRLSGV